MNRHVTRSSTFKYLDREFFSSSLGRLFIGLALSACLIASVIAYQWFESLKYEAELQLETLLEVTTESVESRLAQKESILKILGQRIMDAGGPDGGRQVTELIQEVMDSTPLFIGIGLIGPDGEFLHQTTNFEGQKLPNVLQYKHSGKTFQRTLETDKLVIGNTYFYPPMNDWIIPLRLAVWSDGAVQFVLTSAASLDGDENPWLLKARDDQIKLLAAHFADDSGEHYLIYYDDPTLFGDTLEEVYYQPLPNSFIENAASNVESTTSRSLNDFLINGAITSYVNSTPGLPPAMVALRGNARFEFVTAARKDLSSVYAAFSTRLGLIAFAVLGFAFLFYLVLNRIFMTDRRNAEALYYTAHFDRLTKLPNKYYLDSEFDPWVRDTGDGCLVLLDIDHFKELNDHFGRQCGDEVLKRVARIMSEASEAKTLLARLHGDEFVLCISNLEASEALSFVERLIERLSEPAFIDDHKVAITACAGVELYSASETTLDEALTNADTALVEAKKTKLPVVLFDRGLRARRENEFLVTRDLKDAIVNNEMYLEYQPQIDGFSGRVIGVEALLRWHHPSRQNISPAVFIPIAEKTGQILKLGEFVIERAFEDFARLSSGVSLSLSINLSVNQLVYSDIRSFLTDASERYGVPANAVVLEVTESMLVEDFKSVDALLKQLRGDGYRISLDDFGTGYSSLLALRNLPIDELKIDRAFVKDLSMSEGDRELLSQVLEMAHKRHLTVVAEGVETDDQAAILKRNHCDSLQGFLYSRSLSLNDLQDFLSAQSAQVSNQF